MNGLPDGWKCGLMNENSGNGKREENDVQRKGAIMRIRERIKSRGREGGVVSCAVNAARQDGGAGMHSLHASWNVTILHLFSLQLGKKPVPLTATLADPDRINSWCLVPTAGN